MRRHNILLLAVLIILYLGTSFILDALYGPSIGYQKGEDYWRPDGNSGWVAHGEPASPPPDEASVEVPLVAHYLPILIPGFLLALFLFTPLGRMLEKRPVADQEPTLAETDGEVETDESSGDEPREA